MKHRLPRSSGPHEIGTCWKRGGGEQGGEHLESNLLPMLHSSMPCSSSLPFTDRMIRKERRKIPPTTRALRMGRQAGTHSNLDCSMLC
eukprot:318064-Hanusia_phi.AAC.1